MRKIVAFCLLLLCTENATSVEQGQGNMRYQSCVQSKKKLDIFIYDTESSRTSLYCGARFDRAGTLTLPDGFTTEKYVKRTTRVEWEHVVPAENFGRTFVEWRDGDPQCVDNKGKSFKGRKCAEKVNMEYRFMQSDMYNLYPAIGAVNAARSNYNFLPMPHESSYFGSCPMKIENGKADPPEAARGKIARAYLYMEQTYSRYRMSSSQRKLMEAWDKMYPVTTDECRRTQRIEKIQGNENITVKNACIKNGFW